MKKLHTFFISLLVHVTLSFILFFYLTNTSQDQTKILTNNYIPSYAVSIQNNFSSQKEKILPQKIIHFKKTLRLKKLSTNNMTHHPLKTLKPSVKKMPSSSNMTLHTPSNTKMDALLALLHRQIAAKQSYPESALLLQQNGTVRIGFLLFPDGHISQISVLQSSGFTSIDASALSALNEITPIKEAYAYLQKERYFSVDVVFNQWNYKIVSRWQRHCVNSYSAKAGSIMMMHTLDKVKWIPAFAGMTLLKLTPLAESDYK